MRPISLGPISVAVPGVAVNLGPTFASIAGTNQGPFAIVAGVSDKLFLKVDGGAGQIVTLTPGAARTALQIAADVNGQTAGVLATAPSNRVKLSSNIRGVGSSVLIEMLDASADVVLGLVGETIFGFADIACAKIRLTPLKANVGDVYVGIGTDFDRVLGEGLIARIISVVGFPPAGDSFILDSNQDSNVLHTMHYSIDSDSPGDGVNGVVWIE